MVYQYPEKPSWNLVYLFMDIFISDQFKRKSIIKLGCILFYQSYTRMSLISLNDVNYRIICFSCVTKKTFIENNAYVANNIYKQSIKYFSDIFATRNCLNFLVSVILLRLLELLFARKVFTVFQTFYYQ